MPETNSPAAPSSDDETCDEAPVSPGSAAAREMWIAIGCITWVLAIIHLAVVLFVEPIFLGMFESMGGSLPFITQLTAGAPRWLRVAEVLLAGPVVVEIARWRSPNRFLAWTAVVPVVWFLLIPVEIFALYQPMFDVVTLVK
jgi:hypothetical protein